MRRRASRWMIALMLLVGMTPLVDAFRHSVAQTRSTGGFPSGQSTVSSPAPSTKSVVTPPLRGSGVAPATSADTQKTLEQVRREIGELKRQVVEKQRQYQAANEILARSERAVMASDRTLTKLQAQYDDEQKSLEQLHAELRQLDRTIVTAQTRLSGFFRQQYIQSQRTGVKGMLNLSSWDKIAQIQTSPYLTHLVRAQTEKIAALKEEEARKARLITAREGRIQTLGDSQEQERQTQQALTARLQERQTALETISKQLLAQQNRLAVLQKDEARLTRLITQIRKRISVQERARQRQRTASRQAQEKRERESLDSREPGKAIVPGRTSTTETGSVAVVEGGSDDAYGAMPFSQLQGQLRYPVSGHLMNRFGETRGDTGSKWKGLFIQAPAGQAVRALADGRVVFADSMRGYGNLIIIDHGQGYLSICGHNETLLKPVGAVVKTGDAIATVGNSGTLENFGLYFELRYQDQPVDPIKWMKK